MKNRKIECVTKKYIEDTDLFWNIENTSNSGFIIPIERYCSDPEVFCEAYRLVGEQFKLFNKISRSKSSFTDMVKLQLYEKYKMIFEGKFSYKSFCEFCGSNFDSFSFIKCGYKDRKMLVYDTTAQNACILTAVPQYQYIEKHLKKNIISYRFISNKITKIGNEWKLTDEFFKNF